MHINAVEYSELSFENGLCEAVVTLLTQTGATHCVCRVAVGVVQTVSVIHTSLLTEALRQIARMPEYRRGTAQITLAHHLAEADLPMAA